MGGSAVHHHHPQFPVGSLVEVRTDEEGFKGVFYVATVVPSSARQRGRKSLGKIHIEYHNLLASENAADRLIESVDVSFIRPAPPPNEDFESFGLNDTVDAFHRDGWWTGKILKVLEGGRRFVVTFWDPPDELEFGLSELRVHWDWCNGTWFRPEKQGIARLMFKVGRKVEVSYDVEGFQDAWFPATILEVYTNGTYWVGCHRSNISNEDQFLKATVDSLHIRPYPPVLKDKSYVLLEKVDCFFDFGWWNGVITKVLEDCRYVIFFKQKNKAKEFHKSNLRPHMDWKECIWSISSSQTSEQTKTGDFSQKRKRGRPRKELMDNLHVLVTGNAKTGSVASSYTGRKDGDLHGGTDVVMTDNSLAFNEPNDELTDGSDLKKRNKNIERTLAEVHEQAMKESVRLPKSPSKKGGRQGVEDEQLPTRIKRTQIPTSKDSGKTLESISLTKTLEKTTDEVPHNELDEPLSKCIEGMKTPTIKDSELLPVSLVEECVGKNDNAVFMDVSEKQNKSGVLPCAFDDICTTVPNELEDLPFAKNVVIWKAINSMDILQRIPQRPHFRPLVHFKESSREGLAVGYMVTFSRVVEKASSLQINDPESITGEILETLQDLEKYGFDVKVVEDCVGKMLELKHKQEDLKEEAKGIDSQISHHSLEKQKMVEEIGDIRRQILMLQEKISVVASAQEKEESEIVSLQSKRQKVEEDMKVMELDFQNLAASL